MRARVSVILVCAACLLALGGCGSSGSNGGSGGASACGPNNCAGCCFNGACQTGSTNTACGKAGLACQSCTSWQTCSPDQMCAVDPGSTWNVIAVSTTLPGTDPSGAEWDAFGGAPDPYAACQVNNSTVGSTGTVSDSFSATWNQVICPNVKASLLMTGQAWSICVWDADVTSDDLAGCWPTVFSESDFAAAMTGQTAHQGLVAGTNSTPTGGTLTLKLARQ